MNSPTLAGRLRSILSPTPSRSPKGPDPHDTSPLERARAHDALEQVLGGAWRDDGHPRCFVVERAVDGDAMCGRARVADLAACFESAATHAPLLTGGAPARAPFLFIDLETTGLSGGAGTHAFLVGCAWFDADRSFVTRQYILVKYADERPLLEAVGRELSRAGALVSFNGKSFDAPVLETRYLFHRLEWAGGRLPHVDVLHPARRFWGSPQARGDRGAARSGESSCSLTALERHVLGARRTGDVPGSEIPARYFQFVRSGDARPLAAVLEHNRLDLLSLAGLCARLLHLVGTGPGEAQSAQEALALGRVYTRAGLDCEARRSFERALALIGPVRTAWPGDEALVRIESLRGLAVGDRRARRFPDATAWWRQIVESPGCPAHIAHEALEALAIHHEHRARDLEVARTFAVRSVESATRTARAESARRRIERIDRKMVEGRSLLPR